MAIAKHAKAIETGVLVHGDLLILSSNCKDVGSLEMQQAAIVVKVALHILRLTIRAIVQIKQEKKTMQQNALSHFLLIGAFGLTFPRDGSSQRRDYLSELYGMGDGLSRQARK